MGVASRNENEIQVEETVVTNFPESVCHVDLYT